jgi:hypothetical protein
MHVLASPAAAGGAPRRVPRELGALAGWLERADGASTPRRGTAEDQRQVQLLERINAQLEVVAQRLAGLRGPAEFA